MTAEAFATLTCASSTGPGKWKAKCPAHADRSPSLTIREGRDKRILVHCFAGCTPTAIVKSLGLRKRDLFSGPPPTRAQLAALDADSKRREDERRVMRRDLRAANDAVRMWRAVVEELGEKLVTTPDEDAAELATSFHKSLAHFQEAESVADQREAQANRIQKGRNLC